MFSNRIANSAKFLQMPVDAQLLYFHMVLRADDDGIVEAYPITKLINPAPDSFKVLIIKNFIKQLNEDQVVVITDWIEHNKIRADRKVNSIYLPLLREKCPELPIVEPKARTDVKDKSRRLNGGQSTDGVREEKLREVNSREEKGFSSLKKKPFYDGQEMRKSKGRWWVLPEDGSAWLEFAGEEEEIEWR